MKYCIGCAHLNFTRGDPGYDTEFTAGIGAEEASMSCGKGHWFQYLSEYGLFNVEQAMRKADTCLEYKEREQP